MKGAFLGIDIGTSSCKALLLSSDGEILGTETQPYAFEQPREGWAEQDPAVWIKGAAEAVRALRRRIEAEILCVGLSGQMHGMTALDKTHAVLRPTILWNDQRNAVECDEITDLAGGLSALTGLVNNRMLPGFTGGKIRWFAKHEAAAFEKTKIILNPKDYIRLVLTGEIATEVSEASGTGLFDVVARRWSKPLLELISIDPALLPPAYESQEISGRVSASGEATFGIPKGTPVIGGGGDAVIQTFGSGVLGPESLQTTIGTGGIVATALHAPLANAEGRVQVSCNVLPDLWHCMGVSLNAGSALAWWREAHSATPQSAPAFDQLSAAAASISIGADGLLFLPYLMGERCPWPDPHLRGGFIGLRAHHRLEHFHRAVFEGISFALRDMAERVNPTAQAENRLIYASGGGASSAFWNKLQADVFSAPVVTTASAAHGAAFGAAVLAGIGAGHWPGPEAVNPLFAVEGRWEPEPQATAAYDKYFAIYRSLHGALESVTHQISDLSAGT